MKTVIFKVFSTNLLAAVAGFLLSILLSRYLSIQEFGQFNYIVSIIIILYTIFDFGFVNTVVIYYNKYNKKLNNSAINILNSIYKNYMLIIVIISFIIITIIKSIFDFSLIEVLSILVGSYLLFLVKYMQSIHQAIGSWLKYNQITLFNNYSKLVIVGVGTFLANNSNMYKYVLFSYCAYYFVLLCFTYLLTKKYLKRANREVYKNNFRIFVQIIWPIGLVNIMLIILMRSDVLLIKYFLDDYQLGLYSVANQLSLVFPLITTAVATVFLKEASSKTKKDFTSDIIRTQKKLFLPVVIIILSGFILSEFIITNLFGVKYIASVKIFNVLLVAQVLGVFFVGVESYTFVHHQKIFLLIKITQVIIFISTSIVLLNLYNMNGILIAIFLYKFIGWSLSYYMTFIYKKNRFE